MYVYYDLLKCELNFNGTSSDCMLNSTAIRRLLIYVSVDKNFCFASNHKKMMCKIS